MWGASGIAHPRLPTWSATASVLTWDPRLLAWLLHCTQPLLCSGILVISMLMWPMTDSCSGDLRCVWKGLSRHDAEGDSSCVAIFVCEEIISYSEDSL